MKLPCTLLWAALALASGLAAQPPFTIPHFFKGNLGPRANLAPLGRTKVFMQTWYRGDNLPSPIPVVALGWRVDSNVSASAKTVKLEIVLDNTTRTFATLVKAFKSNLSARPVTFFKMKNLNLPPQNRPTNPDRPAAWIPADTPFVFLGPHLIVQVDVQTSTTPRSTGYNTDAYTMGSTAALTATSGKSCGGTTSVTSSRGQLTVTVNGALPNTPVTLLVGVDNQRLGASRLPLDLGPFGFRGCELGVAPKAAATLRANGAGRATLSANVGVFRNAAVLFFQAVHPKTGGLASTNVAHALLGGQNYSVYLYNWTRFGPSAQYGPFSTNRGAVMLMR